MWTDLTVCLARASQMTTSQIGFRLRDLRLTLGAFKCVSASTDRACCSRSSRAVVDAVFRGVMVAIDE